MFEPNSRYANLPLAKYVASDGRETVYVTRRFLPRLDRLLATGTVLLRDGDRLDLVAARALGASDAWWRLMDSNPTLHPEDLERPGAVLLVAIEAT